MSSILSCFSSKKPVIGVIHTKGDSDADVFERAKKEIALYQDNGVDGVLVETYYGTYYQVEKVLDYLAAADLGLPYGVNCLNVDAMGFALASKYRCSYLQLDSVVGHVKPRDEDTLDAFFKLYRENCPAYVMGGVRFKYQPVLSQNTVERDLQIATGRCDAVCVTQDATGQETSLDKIIQFRKALGDFPMFVCAGVTPENIGKQLAYADGAVVGSYFKDNFQDSGDVCAAHVAAIVKAVRAAEKDGIARG
ncbi:MAG: BtpA/SgcQ family protein [Ruthenibacterium sp.]